MNIGIGGKPRAGKSKRAMLWVIEQLRLHRRPIVTNLAIKLHPWIDGKGKPQKGLLAYLNEKYGQTFDAERRIYLLRDEECSRFWAIRPQVPSDESEPVRIDVVPRSDMWRFDANKYPGCCYVIDEADVYFPSASLDSKRYSCEDPEAIQWAKQAGRGGDDWLFISQNLVWVSTRLRGTAQECWLMTNMVHERWGFVRKPDKIRFEIYCRTPPAPGEESMSKGMLTYDREGIDGCYNTAAGVGVRGNAPADIGQKAKGLHWSWIPAGIVGAGILALVLLLGFKQVVFAAFGHQQASAKASAVVHSSNQVEQALMKTNVDAIWSVLKRLTNVPLSVKSVEPAKKSPVEERPKVIAYCTGSQGYAVSLDDGTIFLAKRVEDSGRECLIDGVIYARGRGKPVEAKEVDSSKKNLRF